MLHAVACVDTRISLKAGGKVNQLGLLLQSQGCGTSYRQCSLVVSGSANRLILTCILQPRKDLHLGMVALGR